MVFFGITAISTFIGNPRIETFHYDMFHGLAERDGMAPPHDTPVYADSKAFSTLFISRTGRGVPEICQPSRHLVVSEKYAQMLRGIRNIRLAPVIFKRLVDVDYQKGNFGWRNKWGNVADPCDLLRNLPDVAEFHRTIGQHYELQGYRWRDLIARYPAAQETRIFKGTPPWQETTVMKVSTEMLKDHPLFTFGTVIVMNQEIFSIVKDGFDRDFFVVNAYSLAPSSSANSDLES
jgi:hypothetical protein